MNSFKNLINGTKPTLVDFFAVWCGPCKMMHPILEELKAKVGESANVLKINVDTPANRPLAAQYQVRSIPTLILFKEGRVVWQHTGATDLSTLEQAIRAAEELFCNVSS